MLVPHFQEAICPFSTPYMFLTYDPPTSDTMNPLDDHELLLWAMRAGLTRDEVRQAVRRGLAHPLATRPRRETSRSADP